MDTTHVEIIEGHALAHNIPLIWAKPKHMSKVNHLVIWQTCFGGKKERVISQLQDLAKKGFIAVSFDLREHGERTIGCEPHEQMIVRVSSNRRLYFWPIIAHTAEDFSRVIDWSIQTFRINGSILAGGISMGGDISLAAAAIDHRIEAICAVIATPDWLRPGSIDEQGQPDSFSNRLYEKYNPLTNIQLFEHKPHIIFVNAGADSYVPPEAAHRFLSELRDKVYNSCPERIQIDEIEGKEHGFHPEMWPKCLEWFCTRAEYTV